MKFYGVEAAQDTDDAVARHVEAVRIQGFSVMENALSEADVAALNERVEAVYARQRDEFGEEALVALNEQNVARCLLAYDDAFVALAASEQVLPVVRALVGNYVVLHLQNGIISRPGQEHHQSSWHRDLPYQSFVSSRPLAVNVYYCLCDYTPETGGTMFLPFSHREEHLPSRSYIETHETTPVVPAGAALFFDSMLFHRAGYNSSSIVRRGINHVYTTGIIRQQISLPDALDGRHRDDPAHAVLLGYDNQTPGSVQAFRERRLARLQVAG